MIILDEFNSYDDLNEKNCKIGMYLIEESNDTQYSFFILQIVDYPNVSYNKDEYHYKCICGILEDGNKIKVVGGKGIYFGTYGYEKFKVIPESYYSFLNKVLIFQ